MMTTEELIIRLQNLDPSHEMMSAGHRQMAYIDCTPLAVWNAMRSVAIGEPQDQAAQASP